MEQFRSGSSDPTAYVLGMDANGLGLARSLGRRGIQVVGVDSRPAMDALRSKYVRPLSCGDLRAPPDSLLRILNEHAEQNGRGILYPTSDFFVLFISRHRDELSKNFDFNMPSSGLMETLLNKRLQYQEAARRGISIPKTFYPTTMEDLDEIFETLKYPAFIKPCYPSDWYRIFDSKGFLANNDQDLVDGFHAALSNGIEVIIQEFIIGPSSNIYSFATYISRDGWMAPPCAWQKVRQAPVDFGVGSFVRTVKEPRIEEIGVRFLKGIGYTGIVEMEFKRDEKDDEFKLIEMNARSWLQNALAARAGVDTAYLQYLDLTGAKLSQPEPCQEGMRWIDLLNDFSTFWVLRKRGELTTRSWIRSCLGAEVLAYGALDDLRPVFSHYQYGLSIAKTLAHLLKGDTKG
jgi:D-aspartate ligase